MSTGVFDACLLIGCMEAGTLACDKCGWAHYCSEDHKEKDFTLFHDAECQFKLPELRAPLSKEEIDRISETQTVRLVDIVHCFQRALRFRDTEKGGVTHAALYCNGFVKLAQTHALCLTMLLTKYVTAHGSDQLEQFVSFCHFPPALAPRQMFHEKNHVFLVAFLLILESLSDAGFTIVHEELELKKFVLIGGMFKKRCRDYFSTVTAYDQEAVSYRFSRHHAIMKLMASDGEVFVDLSAAAFDPSLVNLEPSTNLWDWFDAKGEIPIENLTKIVESSNGVEYACRIQSTVLKALGMGEEQKNEE